MNWKFPQIERKRIEGYQVSTSPTSLALLGAAAVTEVAWLHARAYEVPSQSLLNESHEEMYILIQRYASTAPYNCTHSQYQNC